MFELRCKDVGFDCAGVVRGDTKEEVLKQAAAHADRVHNTQVTPEMAERVAALIREQPRERGAR
jgi:predicted small metal-binding protein